MPKVRGREAVKRMIAEAPEKLANSVLRGAARAAATVVADEARSRSISKEVSEKIEIRSRRDKGRIIVKIRVKDGWARSVGTWLEYGTDPHFITVDDSQRQGMSANRINRLGKSGTLVIAGEPVGQTVFHPGARPHPFLRPALDLKEAEAIAAAQSYINSRIGPGGITDAAVPEDDA